MGDLTTGAAVLAVAGWTDGSLSTPADTSVTQWSQRIETYLGRVITSETYTDEYHYRTPADSRSELYLRQYPATTITTVTVGATVLTSSDYRLEPNGIGEAFLLRRIDSDGFPIAWEAAQIAIDYDAGYTTIPPALVDVCTLEVIRAMEQTKGTTGTGRQATLGLTGSSDDNGSLSYVGGAWLETSIAGMAPFKRGL